MRGSSIAASLALAVSAVSTALAQPPAAGQLSAFYAACLASGGSPGIFAEGERGTAILFAGGGAARLVSIAVAPGAAEALRVALTAHHGNQTLPYVTLGTGGSAAFVATSLSAQPNGRPAEYCLRVR